MHTLADLRSGEGEGVEVSQFVHFTKFSQLIVAVAVICLGADFTCTFSHVDADDEMTFSIRLIDTCRMQTLTWSGVAHYVMQS